MPIDIKGLDDLMGDINRMADEMIRKNGAVPTELGYAGYPKSICASVDDEVVHGKKTIIDKIFGEYEDKGLSHVFPYKSKKG